MAVKRRENPASVLEVHLLDRHPLNRQGAVEVEIWYEAESKACVTRVPRLFDMSSFGSSEEHAPDSTAGMLAGWIAAMGAEGKKIPLSRGALAELMKTVADWA